MQTEPIRQTVPDSFRPIRQPKVGYLGYVLVAVLCLILIQLVLAIFPHISESISQSAPQTPYNASDVKFGTLIATVFGILASLATALIVGAIILIVRLIRYLRIQQV